jgi:integrase
MPKAIKPLSPSEVANAKAKAGAYKLRDGGGLHLLVTPDRAKWWRFDYRRPGSGKRNTLSLGTFPDVSLKRAREKREDARRLLADGIDPGENRKSEKAASVAASANTFEAVAREWLGRKAAHEWGATQLKKETRSLERHVFPWIGKKPIADLGVSDVRPLVLRQTDAGHHELAHRLRANLSRVFVYAAATERIEKGTNPAAPIREVMPPRKPSKRLPTITDASKIGELMRAIDAHAGTFVVGCALKLSAMWACRPGEIRQAEWAHASLDGENPTLTLPPSIRKLRRIQKENPDTQPHVVPLSTQAVAILRELKDVTGNGKYIFHGARDRKRPMSEAAVTAALARLGYKNEIVAHGFRHMASTLLNESGWNPDAIERQLSHKDKDKIRGTYNLAQYMDERRRMMQSLADHLDVLRVGSNVVPMKRKANARGRS